MALTVKLWGVRGSLPSPLAPSEVKQKILDVMELYCAGGVRQTPHDFVDSLTDSQIYGYGGHTSCFQYSSKNTEIIVDGGSGLKNLGEQMMNGKCGLGQGEAHLLMTHFHWDHLIGLPFFMPFFTPGNTIHFYAVQEDLAENIRRMFTKPNFPVPFHRLPAKIEFHIIPARQTFEIGDIKLTAYELDHPDTCFGYRIESGGKSFAHCVDTEARRISPRDLGADLPLYQKVDVMVFDAQYSFLEAVEKIDWGHASGPIGIDIAIREQVKKVLFVHHDPSASEKKIAEIERMTRDYYEARCQAACSLNQTPPSLQWCFAREGMVVEA